MQPLQAASLPPRIESQNAGPNGHTFDGHHKGDITGVSLDEKAFKVNELRLLSLQIEQLLTANRRKDEFLAILSHELRSPLASIQYGIGVLRGPSGEDVTVRRGMHELIERQVRQVTLLAAGLLDVGRITSGHLQVQLVQIDLRSILVRAIETLEPDFKGRDQEFVSTWTATSVSVMADASRLEQVFVNLLANASKYTDAGGQISLSLSVDDGRPIVRIKDSGIGIAAHALSNIFDLYVQADATAARSRSGLGIGLALVRSIVQLHGGSVIAKSAGPGQGSEFIVSLPARA
jgi:signal transduction histidine kinase